MGPWLIGVALGYLIVGIKSGKVKLKLTPVRIFLANKWWLTSKK